MGARQMLHVAWPFMGGMSLIRFGVQYCKDILSRCIMAGH